MGPARAERKPVVRAEVPASAPKAPSASSDCSADAGAPAASAEAAKASAAAAGPSPAGTERGEDPEAATAERPDAPDQPDRAPTARGLELSDKPKIAPGRFGKAAAVPADPQAAVSRGDAAPTRSDSTPAPAAQGLPPDFQPADIAADAKDDAHSRLSENDPTGRADAALPAPEAAAGRPSGPAKVGPPDGPPAPDAPPEARFADANHARIVAGVRGELLPNGGTMHLRLDPPELGDLQVSVHLRDGVITAAFQTSNDDATRLLSHSLGDLKTLLESQGVAVGKLHVQQSPRRRRPATAATATPPPRTTPTPAANGSGGTWSRCFGTSSLKAKNPSTWWPDARREGGNGPRANGASVRPGFAIATRKLGRTGQRRRALVTIPPWATRRINWRRCPFGRARCGRGAW